MVDVLTALQVSVVQVVITEMRDHIFFAELHVRDASGAEHHISSRPSDGLAIAARTGCPIFATEELLAEAGQVPPAVEEDDEAIIDEFRDFLDDLNPDDFRAE
jgi:bifunctional DNase/RNase